MSYNNSIPTDFFAKLRSGVQFDILNSIGNVVRVDFYIYNVRTYNWYPLLHYLSLYQLSTCHMYVSSKKHAIYACSMFAKNWVLFMSSYLNTSCFMCTAAIFILLEDMGNLAIFTILLVYLIKFLKRDAIVWLIRFNIGYSFILCYAV